VVTCIDLGVDDRRDVGGRSIEAGVKLCRWFAAEMRRIYTILGETQEERDSRRLIEYIASRKGTITVKQLQNANGRRYRTSEHARLALDALANVGMGKWEHRPATAKGGRPTDWFILNTPSDETDETDETPSTWTVTAVGPSDETSDETSTDPQFSEAGEGFVGQSDSRTGGEGAPSTPAGQEGVSSDEGGFVGHSPDLEPEDGMGDAYEGD
jgi:hypothetical protein